MAMHQKIKTYWKNLQFRTYFPAVLALVVVCGTSMFIDKQKRIIQNQTLRAAVLNEASMIKSRLEGTLNADYQILKGLAAVLATEPDMTQERFSTLARGVLADNVELLNMGAAPGLVIRMVHPLDGNRALLGLDYNDLPAQRAAAYQARDSGEAVLAGPLDLVQGGRGLILRVPIFTGPDQTFWGILSAVVDVDVLWDQAGLSDPDLGLELTLVGTDGRGADGALIFGSPDIRSDAPVTMDILLPKGSWHLSARPVGGWDQSSDALWRLRLSLFVAGALILVPTFLVGHLSVARQNVIQTLSARERQLKTVSDRLNVAVQTSKIGIWDLDVAEGVLVCDLQMRRNYGLADQDTRDLNKFWKSMVHPDDLAEVEEAYNALLKGGATFLHDYRIVLPSGDIRHIRGLANKFVEADGREIVIGVNWDVSEDAQLREELTQANVTLTQRNDELNAGKRALEQAHATLQEKQVELRRLSMVAKYASDGIFLCDLESRIFWANDAFETVTGFSREQAIGQRPRDLWYGPETDQDMVAKVGEDIARQQRFYAEMINYRPNGEPHWMASTMVPVPDDSGEAMFLLGVKRDISETKDREAALAKATAAAEYADRAKSEFLANMSHEIRTPMNGIIGMADLLADVALDPEARDCVQTIRNSSQALLKIINDILDLSSLEAGRLAISPADFDLHDCAEDVVALLRAKADEKKIRLHLEMAPDLPRWVRGDDGRLRQILINLIGNAVKFTSEGAVKVRIRLVKGPAHRVAFEVEDSGIGLSKDQQGHIFDRFTQADAATTKVFGGTGLGLTISNMLAQQMGGAIAVTSEPGRGSCFTAEIQLEKPLAPAPFKTSLPDGLSNPQVTLSKAVVLVAEDNRTNRMLIQKYMKGQPVELVEAVNGRVAVELYQERLPDIILMDMSMPELDGIEATRAIREMDLPQPKIIALTANAFARDKEACLEAGMDHFLTKPIKKTILLQTLADMQMQISPTTEPRADEDVTA